MSSITGSRHNCEQGQPKLQLGGCTAYQAYHNNETTGAGRGRAPPQAPPHRGAGGIPWGGGGRGGVAALHHICVCVFVCLFFGFGDRTHRRAVFLELVQHNKVLSKKPDAFNLVRT